jgi:PTS system glucitol/sorbitol-specific IIA component
MTTLYAATVHSVGADASDLIAGGVLILFAAGAPPELAEVSVLHEAVGVPGEAPVAGDILRIGRHEFRITAVGATAWAKVREIGHVVFSFNGAANADRPGEICVAPAPGVDVAGLLTPGTPLAVVRAA